MADKIIVNKEKVTTLFNKIRTKAGVTGLKTFDEMNDVVDNIQKGVIPDGTAETEHVLSGKTFYGSSETKQTGTMWNVGKETGYINSIAHPTYTIARGYHDGTGTVSLNNSQIAECKAENILKGKNILGVIGTLEKGITPTGTLEITENGEHDVTNYAKVNVNVPTSSGGEEEIPEDKYHIRYFDIDGTILKEEYVDEGYTLSPPESPSYDPTYLQFDTWNYDVETLWVDRPYDIGALYSTINDKTYFHIKVTKGTGLTITLALTGVTSVDWGDGTVNTSTSHTYANEGNYVISITGSISASTSSSAYLLGSATLNECLLKTYISSVATLINKSYCFYDCYSLEVISLPNVSSKTSIGSRTLYHSENLKHINLPKYITSIGEYAIYTGYGGLNSVSIPNVYSFSANAFKINTDCLLLPDSLKSISSSSAIKGRIEKIFARNLTHIYDNFGGNYLKEFSFPNGTTSIRRNAFGGSSYSKLFDLKDVYIYNNETVPILDESSDTTYTIFEYCNKLLTIWVNDKIISDLKANTRWAHYVNFIKPLSEKMPITLEETPTISLNETVLTITDTKLSSRKNYNIYFNGTLVGSTDFRNMTLDISEIIPTTGNVTVKAIYDNWKESVESNSVEFIAASSGYTVEVAYGDGVYDFAVYDGNSASGTYLGDTLGTYTISSGYMYIYASSTYCGELKSRDISGGLSILNQTSDSITLMVTGDGVIEIVSPCLVEDTSITLADGQYKMIQDITYEDNLLVWDFDKGEFASAKPLWIMKERKAIEYNHLVFSDGSELNTVNQHRIFNIEKGMFTYPMTDDTPIGTTTFNDKGECITLVSKEVIEKEVNYYNIITDYCINLFAGTILTSCRLSNIYPVEDMKYVKDNRDIIDYEEFNNIPIEYYYGLRLGEQPVDINRNGAVSFGDTTVEDYVKRLISMKKQ